MEATPQKIIMFGWELPPYNSGGLGVACFGLARALARRGANITFVLPKKMPVSFDFGKLVFADTTTLITSVEGLFSPYAPGSSRREERTADGAMRETTLLNEVYRYGIHAKDIARNHSFDIIHAHDWLSFPAGVAAKEASGKPLVVHIHATEFDRTGGQGVNEQVYAIERAGMEAADRVIAVSGMTKEIIVRHYGIDKKKVDVVHNGIEAEDWQEETNTVFDLERLREAGYRIALFVGRITIQKGPDYFIRLAHRVVSLRPRTIFVFAGSGDMEAQMVHEAARYGIAQNVLFAGFVRGRELAGLYRAADALIMPSVSEPFGITALEAMHHGTPTIVSKQAGVSESSAHMLTADFWDIDEMTDKLIAILDYAPLQRTLQENGKRDVARITWTEAARKCLEVYRNVLQDAY